MRSFMNLEMQLTLQKLRLSVAKVNYLALEYTQARRLALPHASQVCYIKLFIFALQASLVTLCSFFTRLARYSSSSFVILYSILYRASM